MSRVLSLLAACLISMSLAVSPALAQGWDDDYSDDPYAEDTGGGWAEGGYADEDPQAEPGLPPEPELPPEPPQDDAWVEDDDGGYFEPGVPEVPLVTTPTVSGRKAMLRTNGKAAIPRGAPRRVRAIIAAANRIAGKPYKWGGGHARLEDRGYDCSGTVSYALIRAGLLGSPMVSGTFARWGSKGTGRWVTIYANKGHVYMEIAGLRLDTSAVGDPGGKKGVRWRPAIGKRRGFHVRHIAGL
jgi:hypothetical protein